MKNKINQEIKAGDYVKWDARPFFWAGTPFAVLPCAGWVEKVKESTFGSKQKGLGAHILVQTDKYVELYKKRRAFVSVKKLKKI